MKILIVEDEKSLLDSMVRYLSEEGRVCEAATSCSQALQRLATTSYDCVVLDLMLPDGDGLGVLRQIRQSGSSVGVIIVSARGMLDDRLKGLEVGADDYLSKPFSLAELSMRIYAIVRRKDFSASNIVSSNGVVVDLPSRTVRVADRVVELTKTEYTLLLFFIGSRNKAVSKSILAEQISGEMADMLPSYDFVYSHIKNLKAKIMAAGGPDCIRNIYGVGYKWEEE